MVQPMADLIPIDGVSPAAIEALLDAAFGKDRHQRTAYRLRIGSRPIETLSFALLNQHQPIACIQCWAVRLDQSQLVLVGPVAVHPDHQNEGHGSRLMQHMLAIAQDIGDPPMVMIGDAEYYGRFGFSADASAGWEMPGPWEAHRLLARNPAGHPLPLNGMLERADAV
jgi:predicted N-acetyltransferase YhbS